MKYKKREIILIESHIEPLKLTGNNQKTNIITKEVGYSMKKILSSNSFLLLNENISQISSVYELQENKIDYGLLNNIFVFNNKITEINTVEVKKLTNYDLTSIFSLRENILNYKNELTLLNMNHVAEIFGYAEKQIEKIVDDFRLIKVDNLYMRLSYSEIKNVLMYYYTVLNTTKNRKELNTIYPKYICEWVIKYFKGNAIEISAYTFLDLFHRNKNNDFMNEIQKFIFEDIDLTAVKEYLKTTYFSDKDNVLEAFNSFITKE